MTATGYVNDDVVTSVNDEVGEVDLDASDVGAEATGTAAAAVATHAGASDPHGDRAFARGHDVASGETDYVNRPATGAEGEDIWQVRYNGQRGAYTNGYACLRARAPVANQYAFRAQAHASAGQNQAIGSFALSDNTDQLVTYVNGDTEISRNLIVGASATSTTITANSDWLEPDSFGTNISDASGTAGTAPVETRLELGQRVYLRGRIEWTAATISGGSVLLTVAEEHRPQTPKAWSIRTGPNSNVSTILHLATNGQMTNEGTFGAGGGSGTTAYLTLDGISWDLS